MSPGGLERCSFPQQVEFLRVLAGRSRKYVLVLVPNRHCYWYWLWRVRVTKDGGWLFGKECPRDDLSGAFAAAGIRFLGQAWIGAARTEELIAELDGLSDDLREDLLAIHRTALLGSEQKCYFLAALGCVGEEPETVPAFWTAGAGEDFRNTELGAALADALALRLESTARLDEVQGRARALAEELAQARAENAAYRDFTTSTVFSLARLLERVWKVMLPRESRRAWLGSWFARRARNTVRSLGQMRVSARPPADLPAIVRRAQHGPRPVIFPPSLPWSTTLFQRPHHLARQLARLGHLVIYDCNGTDQPLEGFREIEPNLLLYKGDVKHLHRIPDPVVWLFSYNFHHIDHYPESAASVYDWIDDLTVFDDPPAILERNHGRGLREATLVTCVAKPLLEQAQAHRPDALYLPNAAEYERFASPAEPAPDAALADFLRPNSPVAGYYGALAHWFDYTLLRTVAENRPDWSFVLIGPDLDGSIKRHDLLNCPNVIWLGPRDYDTLPGYLRFFDVALIPFVVNAITKATSPLKLYEYFSAGKPVITTPMPECLAYPEVHCVRWAEEFACALDEALAEAQSEPFRARVQSVGAANSWAARARLIESHFPDRPGLLRRAA